jgi:hypothetical protein
VSALAVIRGAIAALVACALATSGCASYRLVRKGAVNAPGAERVRRKLVATRGLRFQSAVPVQAVTADEARTMLERELHTRYSSEELAKLSRIYAMLGLVPPGTDLEHAYLELYARQIAGFYDPIDRRMLLVEGAISGDFLTRALGGVFRRDFAGELVLAHELTHALQDQHYGIDVGRNDLGEDDAQLAQHAVYEGDATLAGFATVLGAMSPSTALSLAGKLEGVPGALARAYPDIPAAVRESIVFQYVAGVNFVSWAYQRAGWDGVNALLVHPPLSTEQVLHPEKYFVRAEYPLAVRLGGLASYTKGEWHAVEDATLGEFIVQVLAAQFLPRDRARAVATGWDGDRLLAVAHDDDLALVWLTAWDTDEDAAEFFAAARTIVTATHPDAPPTSADESVVAAAGASPYRVERRGTKVLLIEGALDSDLARPAERIWKHSTYQPTMPWVPIDLATRDGAAP